MTRRLVAALLLLTPAVLIGCGGARPTARVEKAQSRMEDPLDQARATLLKATDATTAQTALQQVNLSLTQNPDKSTRRLTSEEREFLEKRLGLRADELAEMEQGTYTQLDAAHLEECFLLRDGAASLGVDGLPPLRQSVAAFAWASRQLQLLPGERDPLPPYFVLRLGHGVPVERGLVFLGLLRQFGIPGALVGSANADGKFVYWASAAAVGGQLYLFDHRLGLPLPDAVGRGPVTLAALKAQPELLKALTVDPAQPYDVTPDMVARAEVHIAHGLSALAPRLLTLQDELLGSKMKVRFAVPIGSLTKDLEAAAGAPVRAAGPALRSLRGFLPPEEGGVEKQSLKARYFLSVIPRHLLPPELTQDLPGEPGKVILSNFGQPFLQLHLLAGGPRDLLLRGRHGEALSELVQQRTGARQQLARYREKAHLAEGLPKWSEELLRASAELIRLERDPAKAAATTEARHRVDLLWKGAQEMLVVIVPGVAAEQRAAEITYLLALVMHEQAERAQVTADAAPSGNEGTADREDARKAWRDAASWWDTHLSDYPGHVAGPAARRNRARAAEALGDRARAAALLEEVGRMAKGPTASDKMACLYEAARLRK